jgi:transposase-like protein
MYLCGLHGYHQSLYYSRAEVQLCVVHVSRSFSVTWYNVRAVRKIVLSVITNSVCYLWQLVARDKYTY